MIRYAVSLMAFFVLMVASSARSPWNAEVPEGFYPIKGLEAYLEPFLVKGLEGFLASKDLAKIGEGSHGSAYWIQWPGFAKGAVVKKTTEDEALHEATILSYVNGAGGAPRLISCEPSRGLIVMEYMGSIRLHDLYEYELTKKQWMEIFMSITRQLNQLHRIGVIHADFKTDNVLMSFDTHGRPTAHPIDFGLSTLSGMRSSNLMRYADWKQKLKKYPHCSAEFFRGEALDSRSDIVGLAMSMRTVMPSMKEEANALFRLTERAYSYRREDRPALKDIYKVLKWEYNHP